MFDRDYPDTLFWTSYHKLGLDWLNGDIPRWIRRKSYRKTGYLVKSERDGVLGVGLKLFLCSDCGKRAVLSKYGDGIWCYECATLIRFEDYPMRGALR